MRKRGLASLLLPGAAALSVPAANGPSAASSPSVPRGSVEIVLPRHHAAPTSPLGRPYPSPLHSIYVQPLLTAEEAGRALELARSHASSTGRWDGRDTDRHAAYSTVDFPVEDSADLSGYLEDVGFHDRILDRMAAAYGLDREDLSYLDFFCANYEAAGGEGEGKNRETMDRLPPHRDGSLLSYSVLLTPPEEFSGGGTVFDALRDVDPGADGGPLRQGGVIRPVQVGDCCLHSGKVLHGADPVTAGERTVLVAFVDVASVRQRPDALASACREWGRADVAAYRFRRQERMTAVGGRGGGEGAPAKAWRTHSGRWLPRGGSCLRGYAPALDVVRRRADPERERERRLATEDILLRHILLDDDEREESMYFDGDVTVL